jgi:tRNA-binding EMAP/Myf-like protein
VLPGERRIEVTAIAGQQSQGMLCSGDELQLTPDAAGILILPPETPLGRPLAELYGDVVWTSTSSPTAATRCRSSGSRARSRP